MSVQKKRNRRRLDFAPHGGIAGSENDKIGSGLKLQPKLREIVDAGRIAHYDDFGHHEAVPRKAPPERIRQNVYEVTVAARRYHEKNAAAHRAPPKRLHHAAAVRTCAQQPFFGKPGDGGAHCVHPDSERD